jgi:hypothetical protein
MIPGAPAFVIISALDDTITEKRKYRPFCIIIGSKCFDDKETLRAVILHEMWHVKYCHGARYGYFESWLKTLYDHLDKQGLSTEALFTIMDNIQHVLIGWHELQLMDAKSGYSHYAMYKFDRIGSFVRAFNNCKRWFLDNQKPGSVDTTHFRKLSEDKKKMQTYKITINQSLNLGAELRGLIRKKMSEIYRRVIEAFPELKHKSEFSKNLQLEPVH